MQLANLAKLQIESSRPWNFLRGFDSSQTINSSDGYLTAKTLPSDFLTPQKLFLLQDLTPYILIPINQRDRYKDIYKRYYIDYVNRQFFLCGHVNTLRTINLYYTRKTPDLTDPTDTPEWPEFHDLIPRKMAEMHLSGGDPDELNLRLAKENLRIYSDLLKNMIQYDGRIQQEEYNDKMNGSIDYTTYPNIVDLR